MNTSNKKDVGYKDISTLTESARFVAAISMRSSERRVLEIAKYGIYEEKSLLLERNKLSEDVLCELASTTDLEFREKIWNRWDKLFPFPHH